MSREMRDSGIPWIGEIPNHWKVERIKTIFSERVELSENGTESLLSVSEYYGVDKRREHVEEGEYVSRSENLVGYKKCFKGDFVSNIMLAWKGSFGVSDYDGVVSPAYCVYKPSITIYPKYYHYLFRTSLYTGRFKCFSKGIIDSRLRLYSPYFYDIEAIIPSIEEQQAIADFLDIKCSEIDELISLQEKFIEELKSYKQSVITEAVTKGLNPDVPMKDSEFDWLDNYPSHWREGKIQYVALLSSGTNLTTEQITETGEYPVFGGNGCRGYYSSYNNEGEYVLIGRQGALCGNINLSYGKFWATEHAIVCYPKTNYSVHWFGYLLYSMNLNQYSLASAQPGLSVERIKQLFIPIPPVAEQQSIADYLDKKCEEIDSLISLKQSKIEQLKEYKKSIIFEYVTGKKEVNGY